MAREINLTSSEWCNIIFEDKNKEYGAFKLREESSKRHYIAFGMVVLFVVLSFSILRFTSSLTKEKVEDESYGVVELNPDLVHPKKDNEPIKPIIDVPKPKPLPQIKFTQPIIKPDDQVRPEDEIPPASILDKTPAVISDRTADGDVEGVDPRTIETAGQITAQPVEDETVHSTATIQVQPSFPGGDAELMKFLNSNIRYPVIASEIGIQGKVTVEFVIGKDGSIEDVKIARSVDNSLDAEALRVIKSMPKWIPGKQGGRAVRVKFYVPVNFKLQ